MSGVSGLSGLSGPSGVFGGYFVGPLDSLSNIAAAFSTRRLLAAYTGTCLRLRRSSDNAESDFGFIASGNLNTAAIAAWLGGASGYVTTWYDQSGNARNAVQATASAQPLYVASGQNSRPILRFDSMANDALVATFGATLAQPNSIMAACSTGNLSGRYLFGGNAAANRNDLFLQNLPVEIGFYAGTAVISVVATNPANFLERSVIFNGASSKLYENGVNTKSGNPGANGLTGLVIGNRYTLASSLGGDYGEIFYFNSAISDANRIIAMTAMKDWWNI